MHSIGRIKGEVNVRGSINGTQSRILDLMFEVREGPVALSLLEFRLGKPTDEFACDMCSLVRSGYIHQDAVIETGNVQYPMAIQYRLTPKAREGLHVVPMKI